jgi:hypothetical protein
MSSPKYSTDMLHGLASQLQERTGRAYEVKENPKGLVLVLEDGKDIFLLGYLTKKTLHRMLYAMLIGTHKAHRS